MCARDERKCSKLFSLVKRYDSEVACGGNEIMIYYAWSNHIFFIFEQKFDFVKTKILRLNFNSHHTSGKGIAQLVDDK